MGQISRLDGTNASQGHSILNYPWKVVINAAIEERQLFIRIQVMSDKNIMLPVNAASTEQISYRVVPRVDRGC